MTDQQRFWLILALFLLIFGLLSAHLQEGKKPSRGERAREAVRTAEDLDATPLKPREAGVPGSRPSRSSKPSDGIEYFQ